MNEHQYRADLADLEARQRRAEVRGDGRAVDACTSLILDLKTRRLGEKLHAAYSTAPRRSPLAGFDWVRLYGGPSTDREWLQLRDAMQAATPQERAEAQREFDRVAACRPASRQFRDQYQRASAAAAFAESTVAALRTGLAGIHP